jgi:DNA-binding transcriptional LysR family regulator
LQQKAMQLRHLKTFAAVASTLNFTRAAERVHLAQSSVTEQIQALEADLGVALFDRSDRKLRLTMAGHRLLDYADRLLLLADEARTATIRAGGIAGGVLTIGGLETLAAFRLPRLLAQFHRDHPAVELKLQVAGSDDLRNGTKTGAFDVGFLFGGTRNETGLRAESLVAERLVLIAPPNHRFAARPRIDLSDLAGEPFLVTEAGCVYRQMFEDAFPPTGAIRPPLAGEFGSIGAIMRAVAAGLGCALVPALVAADAGGDILTLPWPGAPSSVDATMIWRRRRVQPPALMLFMEAARKAFATPKPADALLPHAAPSPS